MLLLLKFLIKYKFYHLCKKAGNSILNFDMPDSQIPGQFLQRDFLHICASLYAWNWEQTRNVHKHVHNAWSFSCNHQTALLTWSPSDSVWSHPQHSSPAPTSAHTYPQVSLLLRPSSATRPSGHWDRQARWNRAPVSRREARWLDQEKRSKLLAPLQLGLSTYNHCLLRYDSCIRKSKFGSETEWQGGQNSQETEVRDIGSQPGTIGLGAEDCF